jgi:hypothetical protein
MSCWVAPAVAAEMWHCSVEQVLAAVREGHVPSRVDGQFLLVQVTFPGMEIPPPPRPLHPRQAQRSEELVTPQELAALSAAPEPSESDESNSQKNRKAPIPDPNRPWEVSGELDADEPPVEEETLDENGTPGPDISDWRTVRRQTARLRRPPFATKQN